MTTLRAFQRASEAGWEAAWLYEDRLAGAYASLLRSFYDSAADDLSRIAMAAAGGDAPSWQLPHKEEVIAKLGAILKVNRKTGPIRVAAMRASATPPLGAVGLNFTLRNPFISGVLVEAAKATDIVNTTQGDILRSLNDSWTAGASVPEAAEALRVLGESPARSVLIARTELIAIANGGSHAAALTSAQESDLAGDVTLPPLLKTWLTAGDELVRDTHVEAGDNYGEGNGIPLDEPFFVGDSEMQYPGDPSAPPDEVCNCRCAISYEEASEQPYPITADARSTLGAAMASIPGLPKGAVPVSELDAAPVTDAVIEDAREFVTCLCMEAVSTDDGRFLALDSISWRPLPLTLSAQLETAPEHDDAVVAGRIDSIEKMPASAAVAAGLIPDLSYPAAAVAVIGRGCFANTYEGDCVMGLVADRMLRGVSVELAVQEGELVELPPEDGQDFGSLLDVTVKAEIATACIVAFPAFAEAQIMLASQADAGGLNAIPEDADGDLPAEVEPAATASAWRFRVITQAPLRLASDVERRDARRFAAVDYSAGSMIAVHPTSEQAMACAMPGGQPAGDLHVTLAYLPSPPDDFADIHRVVSQVAAAHQAITGQVTGAGYFAPSPAEKPDAAGDALPAPPAAPDKPAVAAAVAPAAPETDTGDNQAGDQPTEPSQSPEDSAPVPEESLHPHVALVDAPGLSALRQALCQQMSDAGIDYAENHDFLPHMTVGYEAQPGTPAVHLAGNPLHFGNLTVHQGTARTDHPLQAVDSMTASAAGAAPVKPPSEWFLDPELDAPTPMTVTPDGRVYGHIATWGTCHVGIQDTCVRPPRNQSGYRMFHLGELETAEGEWVSVGSLTMLTGHADLKLNALATKRHYDDTGVVAADVIAGEDRHGIWISGAIRPDLSMEKVRALRGSKPSGDWRTVGGAFEMMGVLAVNTPGFPVPRPRARVLAASSEPRVTALVAAGIDLAPSDGPESDPSLLYKLLDEVIPGTLAERQAVLIASVL